MFWVFWLSLFLLVFTYAGHPVLLWALGRIWKREFAVSDTVPPSVFVVLVVRNEAARIVARIENLLACECPGDFEIIVVCGSCDDDTAGRAREVAGPIEVAEAPDSKTKANGLNLGLKAGK